MFVKSKETIYVSCMVVLWISNKHTGSSLVVQLALNGSCRLNDSDFAKGLEVSGPFWYVTIKEFVWTLGLTGLHSY